MKFQSYAFVILFFIAIAFTLEAAWEWWSSTRSAAARRTLSRLKIAAAAEDFNHNSLSLFKDRRFSRFDAFDQLLGKLPGVSLLDKYLQQAGSKWLVDKFFIFSAVCFFVSTLLSLLLKPFLLLAFIVGFIGALFPINLIRMQRKKRLNILERQLPEACDLIARSLRAGHAFFSTIKMVADELPSPIALEFQILSDEINYGDSLPEALKRLANRVPLADFRYLIVAVLVQRESGGNLAELMGNISVLIRQRLKLAGQVRALSAEGRLSAWILCLLPFAVVLVLSVVNPGYINQLMNDPAGFELLVSAITMMGVGALWMRKIIDIRK